MRKSEWSDKQLEELLQNMPKIKDHRDPRDIYQNITLKLNKKKQRSWIIPSVATAAAILLCVILTPNLINFNDTAGSSSDKKSSPKTEEQMDISANEEKATSIADNSKGKESSAKENEQEMYMAKSEEKEYYTALYSTDVTKENVFTFYIPDTQVQNIVPVSVVVAKEDGKTMFDQMMETMSTLQEEEWGLGEYYPLNAQLSVDDSASSLKVNVPNGHYYGNGSASDTAFTATIKAAARSLGLKKIAFYTDDQPGIDLGNYGTMKEMDTTGEGNHGYYFYYPNGNSEKPFLVPFSKAFETIEAALSAMKENIDTHGLMASIPNDMNFEEIDSSGDQVLTLQLKENSGITNQPSIIQTIEAILLTAKDFDFDKVKIEYSKDEKIGKFAFNQELDVPIAANKVELLH